MSVPKQHSPSNSNLSTSAYLDNQNSQNRVQFNLVTCDRDKSCEFAKLSVDTIYIESRTTPEVALSWKQKPRTCLIIKKFQDKQLSQDLLEVALCLQKEHKMTIFVEPVVNRHEFPQFSAFDLENPGRGIDVMIVLGGDGTLLYLASLFRKCTSVPPVICFSRGSLGFLTPFPFDEYERILDQLLTKDKLLLITIRMRLHARILRKDPRNNYKEVQKIEISESIKEHHISNNDNIDNKNKTSTLDVYDDHNCTYRITNTFQVKNTKCVEYSSQNEYQVLNEVLIHRAGYANLIQLDLFIDKQKVTRVQADGLIISTPTGSTAYSVSAGGSLISPTVPCIALTPICPHTLSFRPVIVPDSTLVKLQVPYDTKHCPSISFDGKHEQQLHNGDIVEIFQSEYPLTTFKLESYQHEWFNGLVDKLNWNIREIQKQQ